MRQVYNNGTIYFLLYSLIWYYQVNSLSVVFHNMDISRRDFIKKALMLGSGAVAAGALGSLAACDNQEEATLSPINGQPSTKPTPLPSPPDKAYLAVGHGQNIDLMVQRTIEALGGMKRFVQAGNDVLIKPNICVAYHTYEYAATTNPEVVAALVRLCLTAGASRVRVMDQPFGGTAEQAYEKSGIAKAVRDAGGEMEIMTDRKFRKTAIPDGRDINNWPVYIDALDTDVLINVPIAKHHSLGRLTLGMKNLMGLIQDRGEFHFNLGQRLADLTSLLRPQLTVIDAVRILTNHGPTGGSLDDVKRIDTVIASHDIVAADAYAATLFGLTGVDIPAIRAGAEMGLGTTDLKSIRIEEVNV
jgi:uncharacterized protein (DUF362 family)